MLLFMYLSVSERPESKHRKGKKRLQGQEQDSCFWPCLVASWDLSAPYCGRIISPSWAITIFWRRVLTTDNKLAVVCVGDPGNQDVVQREVRTIARAAALAWPAGI